MIWTLRNVDRAFVDAWLYAGLPDSQAISDYLHRTGKPYHPPTRPLEQRWYYLLLDDPRVRLTCISYNLATYESKPVMAIVGTGEIIGEFARNHRFRGRKGLNIKLQPLAWLQGYPDERYENASDALHNISFQVLDLDRLPPPGKGRT